MKKILLLTFVGFAALTVSAQDQWIKNAPDGSEIKVGPTISAKLTAPDFTITFTNGTVANLYATLNAGNSVLLDQFFTT